MLRRWSPATASTRYKQLQALYRWLEDEEEIAVNPMARMKPPVVPEDALRRLLGACAGKSFEARRDTAMITFLIDTGARRGEIAGLPELHPHQFRHTFAHQWLAQGGGETDLMRLAGWKSRAMLQAQSVPSASLVPCVSSLPAGWRVVNASEGPMPSAARNGWSMFTLRKYLVGDMVVRLSASCDTTGAIQRPSDQPGAQHYERTDQGTSGRAAAWYTVFPGGCVTAQLSWTSPADAGFATEARSIVDFTTRQALQQTLEQRSDGRLHLDPLPG